MQKNNMDLSELFKSGFQNLHKQTLEKNYQQKTLKNRMEDFSYIRRQTRDTLLLQKRNVDLNNMSPYVTPEPVRQKKASVDTESTKTKPVNLQSKPKTVDTKISKRLEMLKKWKEDKEKRLREEKKKAKPIFKVCHVSHDPVMAKLEKAKPVKQQEKFVSKFAPKDHKFQAPKNIKPINIGGLESLPSKHSRNQSPSRKIASNKLIETRAKTWESKMNRDKSKATTILQQKDALCSKSVRIPLAKDNIGLGNNHAPEVNKCNVPKKTQKSDAKITNKTKKKAVDWNFPNKDGESERSLRSQTSPAKKKYQKTPRKRKNDKNCTNRVDTYTVPEEISEALNRAFKSKIEKEIESSDEEISKTPIKKQVKSSDKPSSALETSQGSERNETKKNRTCSESEMAHILTENQALTSEDCEVNPTELNHTPNNNLRSRTSPAKKKYQKTPRKRKNEKNCANSEDTSTVPDEASKTPNRNKKTSKSKIEKEVEFSDEEIIKTPITKQLKSSDKPSSELKTFHGSEGKDTKKNKTCSESELAHIVAGNQVLTESMLTFDDCKVNSQSPTKLNHTPENNRKSLHSKEQSPPVNYISPFVTISRGKDSARKEFKVRQSTGGFFSETPEGKQDFSARTSPKMGAEYFTKTLDKEIDRIESICREWEKYKDSEIPEEAVNLIDVAVGQSKLLMDKKFKQFKSLIEECRSSQYKEKPITCTDLHGFWDMVYMQVGDLDKRFANLETLKLNDWKEVITENKVAAPKKPRGRPKKVAATSTVRDAIRAARNKKKNEEASVEDPPVILTISGPSTPNLPSILRRSLRVSLLNGQAAYNSKRASSSPGLTMMKVTQAIKIGDGLTPSRSILKSTMNKSEKRITKSVLFKDDLEESVHDNKQFGGVSNEMDKENNSGSLNFISFSPVTPTRRSQRLSKKS